MGAFARRWTTATCKDDYACAMLMQQFPQPTTALHLLASNIHAVLGDLIVGSARKHTVGCAYPIWVDVCPGFVVRGTTVDGR